MSDVLRISMITVEMPMYKCELQIRKHIVRGEFEKYYRTNLEMKIVEYISMIEN